MNEDTENTVVKYVQHQVEHIFRELEAEELQEKVIDLVLEYYRKGLIDGFKARE